ncbi:hypothetical protein OGAPHI_001429 [Ogataea philodendri]|uniref:Uncharacterized protein n=1 Tax=Ogataea philodendri TaxID=1378263 RepID=A0A9P8PBP0_9ASCO|nr:uncharacterized protein OGAPHI_001429 [Ogataea philodendri]KAH3669308.1 hypothetical protein OGAPHI_001429 [Ogataea philodendri]
MYSTSFKSADGLGLIFRVDRTGGMWKRLCLNNGRSEESWPNDSFAPEVSCSAVKESADDTETALERSELSKVD